MSQLRLATRISLEDLENQNQTTNQHRQPPLNLTPVMDQGRESKLPREHWHVAQRKYDLDANSPLWKRIVHKYVYLPLFRFFHKRLRFITPDRIDGSWIEHQGCFLTEAEARADAARYPFGFVVPTPLGRSLKADTVEKSAIYFAHETAPDDTHYEVDLASVQASMQDEVNKFEATVRAAKRTITQ